MILTLALGLFLRISFPRTRGDDPARLNANALADSFSPHPRG